MNKTKILIVSPSNKGTIAKCSANLYKGFLKRQDVEVKIVCIHKYQAGLDVLEDCDYYSCKKQNFLANLLSIFSRLVWLYKIKTIFQPTITISTLPACSTLNAIVPYRDRKIGVFHAPNTQIKELKFQYFLSQFSYRYIYPRLDSFSCVSEEVKGFIAFNYPWIVKDKIRVVYNVHPDDMIRKKALELIEDTLIGSGRKYILYCGRLEKVKAPERLLKAYVLSKLSKKGYDLVFMGAEAEYSWKELMVTLSGDDKAFIHYIGEQTNPYKYMKSASMLVSCSRSEGLPGVLIEALCIGTPIITTNSTRGVWEIMNCYDSYKDNLNDLFITEDGIITPNLKDEKVNVFALSEALKYMDEHRILPSFKFSDKVTSDYITDQYIYNL
ncbi:MAG: glycosyltransferase [Eubacteriales bacterium]|nr:glycosyltransferase [Eubacteriales bacterium]